MNRMPEPSFLSCFLFHGKRKRSFLLLVAVFSTPFGIGFRNRVVSPRAERMTPQNAARTQNHSTKNSETLNRKDSIFRTGRDEPATGSFHGRNIPLVKTDQTDQNSFHLRSIPSFPQIFSMEDSNSENFASYVRFLPTKITS